MKKINCFEDVFCTYFRTVTLSLKLGCTGIYVGGLVVLHRCRKYMNDGQPCNSQYNRQNLRMYMLDMITGERSEPENFEMGMQIYPLITPKVLNCCPLRCIFWKFQGCPDPDPRPLLDPCLFFERCTLNQKAFGTMHDGTCPNLVKG